MKTITEDQINGAMSLMQELSQTKEIKLFLLTAATLLQHVDEMEIEPVIEGTQLSLTLKQY